MTSTESVQLAKRVTESAKKSPLKVVSPIIKKYSGHRQGKIKKLKFPRILHGGRSRQKKPLKPQLKTILPKTNAGEVIVLEPELFPCALNSHKKLKEEESEQSQESSNEQKADGKTSENSLNKDCNGKVSRTKLLPSNKKKVKYLKNIEASVELLESNASALKEKREQAFVENYLLRVQQRLKGSDDNLYNQFLNLLCNFQANGLSVCELYRKVKTLFKGHQDLGEDFVAFLTQEQAVECGVFMDHLLLTTMSDFLNMIDIYFSKSPHQIRKIHSVLESLATKSDVTTESVTDSILPLLKGNPLLRDYFLRLLPHARPPENFLTDFEEVEYPELNSDLSDDEEVTETVHLPEVEDSYGGDLCPCKCHELDDEKLSNKNEHCIPCSLKFINGKVFIQQGKLLKPAKVVFADRDVNYHRDRLTPKLYPKRSRKRHRCALFKDNLSPTKSCNLSSDEFKSDIEDEEKGRLKFSGKSPRFTRKKSVSPKHCDKVLSRYFCNETKAEAETEGKVPVGKNLDFAFKEEEQERSNGTKTKVEGVKEKEEFLYDAKEETSPHKLLDLPVVSTGEPLSMISLNDSPQSGVTAVENIKNIGIIQGETSALANRNENVSPVSPNSPPVISIPESATRLFSEAKPILSFLDKLDDAKESQKILEESEEKIIELEPDVKEVVEEANPWTIEEDRVILQTLQVEENCEETFVKIGKNIPARSVKDIKKRFEKLMNILYEMKTKIGST